MDYIRRMPSPRQSHGGPALQAHGSTFPISRRVTTVGRRSHASQRPPDIDLTAVDPKKMVSRQHARLLWQAGVVRVEDLGSLNGTFVDGRRLPPHQPELLADGADVTLGGIPMRFAAQAPWAAGVIAEWEGVEPSQEPDSGTTARTVMVRRHPVMKEPPPATRQRHWWPPARWFR